MLSLVLKYTLGIVYTFLSLVYLVVYAEAHVNIHAQCSCPYTHLTIYGEAPSW